MAGVLLLGWRAPAQTSMVQTYTLLSSSRLTDDCPLCDRVPTVVPLTGTFGLQWLDQNPLVTRYQLLNISLSAGATSGPQYQVSGSGIYQVGGEVAVTQELFVNAQISDGFTNSNALCVSTNGPVVQPWPKIEIQVDQTNGTPTRVYHLNLVAVPVPRIRSVAADSRTGDVTLEWDGNGGTSQLERAFSLVGPYSAVTPLTTNTSFTDAAVLIKSPQCFYRLHLF